MASVETMLSLRAFANYSREEVEAQIRALDSLGIDAQNEVLSLVNAFGEKLDSEIDNIIQNISDIVTVINPQEESKKPIYISPWGLLMITSNYIQKGFLYPLPAENDQDFSLTTFLNDLKSSLSATLTLFRPLAARLATVKIPEDDSFAVFLDPGNVPGARLIHSSVGLKVADILKPSDVPLVVHSFFDNHRVVNHDGRELPLLSVKVTKLVDGIFIGCSMNHMVVDGTSFWHFFNSWSGMYKSKGQKGVSTPPILEGSGSDPIVTLPYTDENEFIRRPDRPLLSERIFHLSSDSVAKLKAKVNSECNTTEISSCQVVSALVWMCVTRARRVPADQETSCGLEVDNRSRLFSPVPENYFGNFTQTVNITTTTRELLSHGIGWAAKQLHEAVLNHGGKEIKEMIDLWAKKLFDVLKLRSCSDGNKVQIESSLMADMYENKFGLGEALAVFSGYGNKFDGKVMLYPGREGVGSMDVEVCLLPENMKALESDEEFMSVVNEE